MPNLDGTGPQGKGPMTGRATGNCPGAFPRMGMGQGFGRGLGKGFSFARCCAGSWLGLDSYSKQDKQQVLADYQKSLEAEIEAVKKQLAELQ